MLLHVRWILLRKPCCCRGRQLYFLFCNVIIWSYGIVMVFRYFLVSHTYSYHNDYLTINSCRPNFTFVLTKSASDCLVQEPLERLFIEQTSIYFIVAILSVLVFLSILMYSYSLFKQQQTMIQRSPMNSIHVFKKTLTWDLYKLLFRFSATSFVYAIFSLPVCILFLKLILQGPKRNVESCSSTSTVHRVLKK